ncbi:hypothetical protein GLA29479_414 [Lysobacter antibioticus]|jgi:hypothetical protein|uniref:hypothetical protein n=1 Tax=Lysobacter antibioticus TaxID=84531 RepID=UPI0007164DBD|nr:hypothetical protein [Lysobacter antibioticus]ALN61300.1 hypothetical protein GLA29479_414 [Lysobacter antibioticus]
MPKLIIRRVSVDRSTVDAFQDDAVNAVLTLPGVTSAVKLLQSDQAVRIEFDWKEPRYESIEEHLNRHGFTSND